MAQGRPKRAFPAKQIDRSQTVRRGGECITNSPLQAGAQTCTRLLAFGENLGFRAEGNRGAVSLLQVRVAVLRRFRGNATILALGLVTSLTLTT